MHADWSNVSRSTSWLQVAALVDMVRDLKLDIFSLKRQEEGLEALAQQIAELLAKHSDGRVIEACAQTLQHCAAAGPDVFKVSHLSQTWRRRFEP